MFLLVVVLSVHVSVGRCIVCPCFFWSLYNDQKKHGQTIQDQKKHGQTIQRPKEAWTDNTTTNRNMDRQYNDQKKHGQAIQRPKETYSGRIGDVVNIQHLEPVSLACFKLYNTYCL
jgi:hypothetical protein